MYLCNIIFSLVFSLCFVVYISWSDSLGRVCPAYHFMHCVGQLGTQFNIPFYIRISLIGNLKMLPFITISVFVICFYFAKFLCHKWKFLSWFFKFLSLLFILIFLIFSDFYTLFLILLFNSFVLLKFKLLNLLLLN